MTTVNLGNVRGQKGESGATGSAATISVGTVTTGTPGTNVSVTNVGTSNAVRLNFTIPRGADGAKGETSIYFLPVATGSILGGVKSGGDVSVSASGNMSVTNLAQKANIADVYNKADTDKNIQAAINQINSLFQYGTVFTNTFSDSGDRPEFAFRYYKDIVFASDFSNIPVVNVTTISDSLGSGSIGFVISNKTVHGFIIRTEIRDSTLSFNWFAMGK